MSLFTELWRGFRASRPVPVGVWIFLMILTLVSLSFSSIIMARALNAKDWPVVQGQILSSSVVQGCGRFHNGPRPSVEYEYQFQGKLYQSGRIALDTDFCSLVGLHSDIASHYSEGQTVRVYVNPERPYEAALLAGTIQATTVTNFLFIACWLALSVYKVAAAWRVRRRSE
jgi:hypothetical protein